MIAHPLLSVVLLLFIAVIVSDAFTAVVAPTSSQQRQLTTSLSMKFLKDLGFDKPSWLPDFGAEKKPSATASTSEGEAAVVNADEKKTPESEPVAVAEE